MLFLTRAWSSRRVLNGRRPIAGTAWMVPPSYYSSQQQYNQTAPPYNPNPGYNDAGYYDAHGNFIRNNVNNGQPFPSVPETHEMNEYPQEKSAYRAPNVSMPEPAYTSPGTVPPPEVGSSSRYEPPSGPPPANRSYDV